MYMINDNPQRQRGETYYKKGIMLVSLTIADRSSAFSAQPYRYYECCSYRNMYNKRCTPFSLSIRLN